MTTIFSIGTDKKILDLNSDVFKRQLENFKDFESCDLLILNSGYKKTVEQNNLRIFSIGGNKFTSFVKSLFFAYSLFKKNNYDLIYTQDVLYTGLLGYLLKIIFKKKLVVQLHGDYLDNESWIGQRYENRFLNFTGKIILKKADKVRAVSNRIVNYVLKFRADKDNVKSLPIGYNEKYFFVSNDSSILNQIVFIGRLIPEKEPMLFLESVIPVVKKYLSFKVIIIGEGELRGEMENLINKNELKNNFIFTGFLSLEQIGQILRNSYMLVKTAKWEGWGMQLVEANASGLPVISTDSGCVGEAVFDQKDGIILKENSVSACKNALLKLIEDKSFYRDLRKNILAKDQLFSYAKLNKEITRFLKT